MILLIIVILGVATFCFYKGYILAGVVCLVGFSGKYGWPALIFTSIYLFYKGEVITGMLPIALIVWNIYGLKFIGRKGDYEGITTTNISYGSEAYVLSLVKWGIVRKILSKALRASKYQFTPSYELAVYETIGNRMELNNPCFVFHYANKDIALSRMNWIKRLLEEGGMKKLILNCKDFNYSQEGIFIDYAEYVEKKLLR